MTSAKDNKDGGVERHAIKEMAKAGLDRELEQREALEERYLTI